ncbi:Hsp90 protein-domain-containing protein [Flagelloscypha sp. PMI_526]|nr:Hsp90 protein-domain-containing protein [Flagelloscypha sp. PMI_526]
MSLPAGWTEHLAPTGHPYFYHAATGQSSYTRPQETKKKKEKPAKKTPIPGTDWLRVITTEGNTFYTHRVEKRSVWTVPDEIKDLVLQLEQGPTDMMVDKSSLDSSKRKAVDVEEPLDEVVVTKKAKLEDDSESEDSEPEEDWQREAAEILAKEAEEERIRQEEETKRMEAEAAAELRRKETAKAQAPEQAALSIEEGKAVFKTLLREKDVNPLHPWDKSLPLFVNDPRYLSLPSVGTRREAFDDYCRDRARELRQNAVKQDKAQVSDPKLDYEALLHDEVKSTRTAWNDFKRTWKKDRRFYSFGRDEREREKRFKEYLKELGEKKKAAARKAEADFFQLLKEKGNITHGSDWKDIKRKLYDDPRYDAVGSSSLRQELFESFVKAGGLKVEPNAVASSSGMSGETEKLTKQERKERAVREREDKVRSERHKIQSQIDKSKLGMNLEEGERIFRVLLVDAIRDPQATWESAQTELMIDPRFTDSPLPQNQQMHLFHTHIQHLRGKHFDNLLQLFETHAPSLDTEFKSLPVGEIVTSTSATKLGFDVTAFDEMLSENAFVEFWGRLGKIGGEGVDGGVKADETEEDEGEGGGGKVDMKELAKQVDVKEIIRVIANDKRYIDFDHIPEQREQWLRDGAPKCYERTRQPPVESEYLNGHLWMVSNRKASVSGGLPPPTMRLLPSLVIPLSLLASAVLAEDVEKQTHNYQSDVALSIRTRRFFFVNSFRTPTTAIEKLRLTALKDKSIWTGDDPLNITIKAVKNDGPGGKIIISGKSFTRRVSLSVLVLTILFQTPGIGMTPEELKNNLGLPAALLHFLLESTTEFLARAEADTSTTNQGNLIGAFGLGFYSSFLVADEVTVASLPPKSPKNPDPVQTIFRSSSEDSSFEIFPDPRGNTLGRGTEITLTLKDDALEYLEEHSLTTLVSKHSAYSSSFPIYLYTQRTEQVPDEDAILAADAEKAAAAAAEEAAAEETSSAETIPDEDEAIVEDVSDDEEKTKEEDAPPLPMKDVLVEDWVHLNSQAPLWQRQAVDPKEISDEEYQAFYKAFFHQYEDALSWDHFSENLLDSPDEFWSQPLQYKANELKLLVKRTFITSDLGEDALPKWASWLGSVEDTKNREKLGAIAKFATNQRDLISLDEYLENKKQGQKQIFYLSEMGKPVEHLAKSVFVEKLHARGYEVLLLNEPLDEIFVQNVKSWKKVRFQDIAKAGLKFGDEEGDEAEEKKQMDEWKKEYEPLISYLKIEANNAVRDVKISNRLVTSPVAIVADSHGYTANMARMMSASNSKKQDNVMHEFAMRAKILEINPRSPLIQGLLKRVEQLPKGEDEKDPEAEAELQEAVSILVDGALVRSGFEVPDTNEFFNRVDRVLRRSLSVSESAKADDTVKPAPAVDPELPEEEEADFDLGNISDLPPPSDKPGIQLPDHMKDKMQTFILPGTSLKKFGAKKGAWAVVTGASDGIGKEFAHQLGKAGFNVVLVARNREVLSQNAKEIESKFKVKTAVHTIDFAAAGEAEFEKFHADIRSLDVGVLGSFAGSVPSPMLATYSGTKAFLSTWSDALASEVKAKGIVVEHVNTFFVVRIT